MVNLPIQTRPLEGRSREWLLRKLEIIRCLVAAGEAVYHYDTTDVSASGEPLDISHIAYDPAAFGERRQEPDTSREIS